jgi:HK97 family phage prohead protease
VKLIHTTVQAQFQLANTDPKDTPFGKGYTFSGHGAAWAKDLAGNLLQKGAFLPSIRDRVPNRMVKVRWMHFDPMGFVTSAKEDEIGLYIEAFVPSTPMNAERIALMESGVVDKMSIGFDPDYTQITYTEAGRQIPVLTLYEVSAVDLPLNEATDVDRVQALGLTPVQRRFYLFSQRPDQKLVKHTQHVQMVNKVLDIPFADYMAEWNASDAIDRLRKFHNATDAPNAEYDANFIYVKNDSEELSDRLLPVVDIIGADGDTQGTPVIIPRAVFSAALAIYIGAATIPDDELQAVKDVIDAYYTRMQEVFDDPYLTSPWDESSEYSFSPRLQFIGATLNATNMGLLKTAHENIGKVLASAKKDSDAETKDEPKETDTSKEKDTTKEADKKKEDKKKEDNEKETDIELSTSELESLELQLGFYSGAFDTLT